MDAGAQHVRHVKNSMVKIVITGALLGAACGLWLALVSGGVEIFQNYVDGVWRYQIAVHSVVSPLVGAVIGALAGANIRLGLAAWRADGALLGCGAGAVVGVLLAGAQAFLVVVSALLQEYDVEYDFLVRRFGGIVAAAALLGASAGLLLGRRALASLRTGGVGGAGLGALVGALTAVALALPGMLAAFILVDVSAADGNLSWTFFPIYALTNLPLLLAGAGGGAAVIALAGVFAGAPTSHGHPSVRLPFTGLIVGAALAVTASSLPFHYVLLGLESQYYSFSIAMYAFRALVGLIFGVGAGFGLIYLGRNLAWRSEG